MRTRWASPSATVRAVAVVGATAVVFGAGVALAGPAAASTPVTWPDPGAMSTLQALLVFGGIPLSIALVITLLTLAPSVARGTGDTSRQWWGEAQWFGEPAGAELEQATAPRAALAAGGGSPHPSAHSSADPTPDPTPDPWGGGAGARW